MRPVSFLSVSIGTIIRDGDQMMVTGGDHAGRIIRRHAAAPCSGMRDPGRRNSRHDKLRRDTTK
jgi:hypothetical protein